MPPPIPEKIPCDSIQQLEQELSALRDGLSLEETEETWDRIARVLARFSAVVKGGGYKYDKELVNGIKASTRPIVSAMNSERTRLSAAALDLLTVVAPRIGLAFEALVPLFIPHILRLATRSNKVYVTRAQASLALIIGYCQISSIIPYLLAACRDSKIVTGRVAAVESVLRCLNKWDWAQKEMKARAGDVEEIIRITGRDKDAGVRQTSRKIFEAYKTLFPERVDEFTGPLTPVTRKYLNIKPQSLAHKAVERARLPSVSEKPKRMPTKSDLASSTSAIPSTMSMEARTALGGHIRSASSNAVVDGSSVSTGSSRSRPPGAADFACSMPPPALIPSRTRNASQSQAQSRPDPNKLQSERHNNHERERVLSTASSTFSIKSAPSNSRPEYEHRPPVRLAASQSRSTGINPVVASSSGQARRVRRVAAVEPHPANRRDLSAMAYKPPVRPAPLSVPRVLTVNQGPGLEPTSAVQNAPTSATGVAFPTLEPEPVSTPVVGHRGAQRVPKPAPPPPVPPLPKVERPGTALSATSKREVKPSVFRRGALGAPVPGKKKESEKSKEGFAPRRGGGLMQPTLSQLSKQKAPVAARGLTVPAGTRVVSVSAVSNRSARGGDVKPTTKELSGGGRGPVSKSSIANQSDKTTLKPVMLPLPASPIREKEVAPESVPLPESPEVERRDQEQNVQGITSHEDVADVPGTTEDLTGKGDHTEGAHEVASSDEDGQDVFTDETNLAPHTPPFPLTDGESDDELEDIEFTTRDAFDPAGLPIKTPRKAVTVSTESTRPERNPLGEVDLNG